MEEMSDVRDRLIIFAERKGYRSPFDIAVISVREEFLEEAFLPCARKENFIKACDKLLHKLEHKKKTREESVSVATDDARPTDSFSVIRPSACSTLQENQVTGQHSTQGWWNGNDDGWSRSHSGWQHWQSRSDGWQWQDDADWSATHDQFQPIPWPRHGHHNTRCINSFDSNNVRNSGNVVDSGNIENSGNIMSSGNIINSGNVRDSYNGPVTHGPVHTGPAHNGPAHSGTVHNVPMNHGPMSHGPVNAANYVPVSRGSIGGSCLHTSNSPVPPGMLSLNASIQASVRQSLQGMHLS